MSLDNIKLKGKEETKNILKNIFKFSNVIAIGGVVVTIFLFYVSEKKKELTLSVDSYISLLDKDRLSGSGIKIYFDSLSVNNLYKVNYSITNTGDVAITKNDLLNDFKISFDTTSVLLKYDIDKFPNSLKTNDKIINNSISLSPDLLNPEDKINLNIYYTTNKFSSLPKTDSRLIDGKIITSENYKEKNKKHEFYFNFSERIESILIWIIILWNIVFLLLISWNLFIQKNNNGFVANLIGFVVVGIGFILTLLYIISNNFLIK